MKTITAADLTAYLEDRQPIAVNQTPLDNGVTITIRHKPMSELAVEEQCTVLGAIAAHLRQLAEDAETARSEIAVKELAA